MNNWVSAIKQSLEYSYNLQAKTAMDKFDEGIDAMVAPLLAGNTLITPQAVIANAMNFIDTNASPYNLTKFVHVFKNSPSYSIPTSIEGR